MYYRFSKLSRFSIVLNLVLTVVVLLIHSFNIYRIIDSNKLIYAKMEEMNVLRETAIRYLEREGYNLFVGGEFATFAGVALGFLALFSLYKYAKDNSSFFAFAASFLCLVTSFVGGLLLFYTILSGKSERAVDSGARHYRNEWERFISRRSSEESAKGNARRDTAQ
jgi:hypothetical protein